ncbi:hypothetical protein [Parapedobacter tibetensis]|uniref:hypothetical protein n=1 Tax=Parapedobacter tibetensis TaxID=2972951 RepID=UPI00214DA7CE|nr:hypothetical protein [Parapedobacter tibetensis]
MQLRRVQFKALLVFANQRGGHKRWSDRKAAPKETNLTLTKIGFYQLRCPIQVSP